MGYSILYHTYCCMLESNPSRFLAKHECPAVTYAAYLCRTRQYIRGSCTVPTGSDDSGGLFAQVARGDTKNLSISAGLYSGDDGKPVGTFVAFCGGLHSGSMLSSAICVLQERELHFRHSSIRLYHNTCPNAVRITGTFNAFASVTPRWFVSLVTVLIAT